MEGACPVCRPHRSCSLRRELTCRCATHTHEARTVLCHVQTTTSVKMTIATTCKTWNLHMSFVRMCVVQYVRGERDLCNLDTGHGSDA